MSDLSRVFELLDNLKNGNSVVGIKTEKLKQNEFMVFSKESIVIPKEYSEIVIRANAGVLQEDDSVLSFSPYGAHSNTQWQKNGSAKSIGQRGIFATRLNQNLFNQHWISYINPDPQFLILEIDTRDIIHKEYTHHKTEVQFSRCNILSNSDITTFLLEIMEMTPIKERGNIMQLMWKATEIAKSYTNTLSYTLTMYDRCTRFSKQSAEENIKELELFLKDKI